MQLFGTKGQKFLHCPGTKWTTGKAQNLAKGRDRLDSLSKSGTGRGTGRYEILTACPVPRDKTGQSRKGRSRTEKDVLKQEKDVLKQEKDILKKEIWSFF